MCLRRGTLGNPWGRGGTHGWGAQASTFRLRRGYWCRPLVCLNNGPPYSAHLLFQPSAAVSFTQATRYARPLSTNKLIPASVRYFCGTHHSTPVFLRVCRYGVDTKIAAHQRTLPYLRCRIVVPNLRIISVNKLLNRFLPHHSLSPQICLFLCINAGELVLDT